MRTKLSDRLVKAMPWLDQVADNMVQIFSPVLGQSAPRTPRDILYGTWLGHPLHPALVALPIGCWSVTAVCDLTGQEQAADASLGIGVLSAVAAAVTGAAQWQDTTNEEKPRRLGVLHAVLNTAALSLYTVSWVQRKQRQRAGGIATAAAGYGILMFSGWLGGELAYDLGIGVNREAFQSPPKDWRDVAALDELADGQPKRVRAGSVPVLLLRHGDEVHAIGAVCTHLGGPLDKGTIEGETVTCPWHGSVFYLRDGSLLHGPATAPTSAFEVRVQDGRVAVRAQAS